MKNLKAYNAFLNEEVTNDDTGKPGDCYIIMNRTDGFTASPFNYNKKTAEEFIKEFPKRFAAQGYYLTSNRERIDPNDVELEMIPVDFEEEAGMDESFKG